MISDPVAAIFILALALIAMFILWSFQSPKPRYLLHRLYIWMLLAFGVWSVLLLAMWLTPPGRTDLLAVLDALTYVGITMPAFYLMITLVFVKGYDTLPRRYYAILIVPLLSILVCLTNPLHHWQYRQFSILRSEIQFGPYVLVTGAYSYVCLLAACMELVRFMWKNPSRLYINQCILLILGGLCPLCISLLSTFSRLDLPITATPLAFSVTVLCNGVAIYRYNLLDITPVATQHVLDWIPDCYLILSNKGLVVSYNKPFAAVFAARYGITENRYLKDCLREEDVTGKTAIYNMITALDACRDAQTNISYEQAATVDTSHGPRKNYYLADVSQLMVNEKLAGFVVIFKDITQLKKSMRQLQDNKNRMMEQERFAFLGQMMGGLAHNLKTPIMSISGSISAADSLIEELVESLDDPGVTSDDYREICGEVEAWFQKIRESTAYMSDIITAIKGQATSVGASDEGVFTLEELVKRTTLLMRHELLSGGCTLVAEYKGSHAVTLHGDINILVQVLGNLVSNAIYAQAQAGGGCITLGLELEEDAVKIYVKDTGPGISDAVRSRLFREMVTSKGLNGSGLGLYISNTVVHGKFNGTMWCEDNPGGGAVFGLTIPLPDKDGPDPADHARLSALTAARNEVTGYEA